MHRIWHTFGAVLMSLPLPVGADSPQGSANASIRGDLVFDGGTPSSEKQMNDFQSALQQHAGKVVWLELSLLNSDPSANNRYKVEARPGGQPASPDQDAVITCGSTGTLGLIDTMDVEYNVLFHRPSDYHGPTRLHIGDRRTYPKHSLKCSADGYMDAEETALLLRGHFVVEVSAIPTAIEYQLFPIHID